VVSHAGPTRIALALATGRSPRDVPLPALAEAITLEIDTAASAAGPMAEVTLRS
jgi:hypothetical protein